MSDTVKLTLTVGDVVRINRVSFVVETSSENQIILVPHDIAAKLESKPGERVTINKFENCNAK